jgi:CBS domain-containing protein
VVENGQPIGMFTERDVLVRVVDGERDANKTLVSEVMTRDLIVVRPETSVSDAMSIITHRRCRHLPVMDADTVIGLVSIGDLTRWVTRHQEVEIEDLVRYITGSYPA